MPPPKPDGFNTRGTLHHATKDKPARVDMTFIFPSVDYPTPVQLELLRNAYQALDRTPLGEAYYWLSGEEPLELPEEWETDEALSALNIHPGATRRDQLVQAAAILLKLAANANKEEG